ncbi:hypothetical protein ACFE04_020359 [Oxalis oulophora]
MASSSSSMNKKKSLMWTCGDEIIIVAPICSAFVAQRCEITCDDLPNEMCTFSIAASGKRCSLETTIDGNTDTKYVCQTSEIVVERISDYIETNECVNACGVDRNSVGISSDSLLDNRFASKLCSHSCYHNCPNIIDLYFNLAAAEGAYLPDLCEKSRNNPHRAMLDLMSSGAAPAPESSFDTATAPL